MPRVGGGGYGYGSWLGFVEGMAFASISCVWLVYIRPPSQPAAARRLLALVPYADVVWPLPLVARLLSFFLVVVVAVRPVYSFGSPHLQLCLRLLMVLGVV